MKQTSFVLGLFTLVCAGLSGCQQDALKSVPAPLAFPPLNKYQHELKIEDEYDRFKNETSRHTEKGVVLKSEYRVIRLDAAVDFDGQQLLVTPKGVTLQISAMWHGNEPVEPACSFLAEGRPIHDDHQSAERPADLLPGWQSQIAYDVFAIRAFLELVGANKVEGRCWGSEFTIDGDLLNTLRDFAVHLDPKAGK